MPTGRTITIFGYREVPEVSPEDYADFIGASFFVIDIKETLNQGNFPPGLVMSDEFGRRAIVEGNYGSKQSMRWFYGVQKVRPPR